MNDLLFDMENTKCLNCGRELAAGRCSWCNTVKPYKTADGESTIGWANTDTSHDRARSTDAATNQHIILTFAEKAREYGVTVKDVRENYIPHHGTASGTLSNLHKAGILCLVDEKRDRCHIYVLPEFVAERTLIPHKSRVAPGTVNKESDDSAPARDDSPPIPIGQCLHCGYANNDHAQFCTKRSDKSEQR